MLAAANRLRNHHDIARAMRQGKFTSAGTLALRVVRTGQPHSRVVVVVSKKISPKAVVRNRLRRRLAAALRTEWATVAPGYDIVVLVRDNVAEEPTTALTALVAEALTCANVRLKA